MRLIDADKICVADLTFYTTDHVTQEDVQGLIDEQPTVDTVKHEHRGENNGMTNFERITQDEFLLAIWLSDGRLDCDMCPVWKDCSHIVDKSCTQLIYEWMKRGA